MRLKIIPGLLFLFLFVSSASFAGSYIYVDGGRPYKWKNGKIEVYIDSGDLAHHLPHSEAREKVTEAWRVWENASLYAAQDITAPVLVSGVDFVDKGNANHDADIDASNFEPYWIGDEEAGTGAYDRNRETVIIFDKNGAIFNRLKHLRLLGDGTYLGVTDLHAKHEEGEAGRYIDNGTIILYGPYWDSATPADRAKFEVAIVHELGHLLNLDHSGLNDDCYENLNCDESGSMNGLQYLPTMFRFPMSRLTEGGVVLAPQKELSVDDISWSALLYKDENNNIMEDFCSVWGTIYDKKGRPFQGAQVVAFEYGGEDPARTFAMSSITGSLYKPCADNGDYYFAGLRPGKTYRIRYGSIPNWCDEGVTCSLGSGINPYAPPRPLEEDGDIYRSVGGSTTYDFSCDARSVIRAEPVVLRNADLDDDEFQTADNLVVDGVEYRCIPGHGGQVITPAPAPEDESTTSPYGMSIKKKGWCSLVGGAPVGFEFILFFLPALLLFIVRRNKS